MRILYVEDHPANLFLVQRVARMGNHDIINYTEGQSALDHFDTDKPDLVLMDVQLPGKLSGLDVVKELRARGHKVPIIAVTAYAMMGDRERCLEAGCDGYIAKPMPVSELVDILKRYAPTESEKASETQATDEVQPASAAPEANKAPTDSTPAEAKPTSTSEPTVAETTPTADKPAVDRTTTEASGEQPAPVSAANAADEKSQTVSVTPKETPAEEIVNTADNDEKQQPAGGMPKEKPAEEIVNTADSAKKLEAS